MSQSNYRLRPKYLPTILPRPILFTVAVTLSLLGYVAYKHIGQVDMEQDYAWNILGDAMWSTDTNQIESYGTGDGFLVSRKTYQNIWMSIEFWVDENVNSGIFIGCADPQLIHPKDCYEVNIWDNHPNQEMRTGAVVLKAMPPLVHLNTADQWNRYEITYTSEELAVVLNGSLTAKIKRPEISAGHIALQHYGDGRVRFRNIRIKQLN